MPLSQLLRLENQAHMMTRFFDYWAKHVCVMEDARTYISDTARVHHYTEGEYFIRPDESRRYWCFILSGLVACVDRSIGSKYHWVAWPSHYFTGTAHAFTKRPIRHAVVFLKASHLLLIPTPHFQFAQQQYPSFAEFVHVLKQRHIDHITQLNEIRLLPAFEQYTAFRTQMKDLHHMLSEPQQIRLLRMHRATFYRAKDAYERLRV